MPDLRDLAHAPVLHESPVRRYRAETRRTRVGRVVLISSPQSGFVWVGDDTPPERVLDLAYREFGPGAPFTVELDGDAAPALEAHLRALGWEQDDEEPALVLTPLPATIPAPPAGLAIRRAHSVADLERFRTIADSQHLPPVEALADPDIHLLLGDAGGVTVATARAVCAGGVVDITGVVTVPEHRRQGYGTALTWAAVAAGAARGCTAATLTATEIGYPIYRKMGFLPVTTFRTFTPPQP